MTKDRTNRRTRSYLVLFLVFGNFMRDEDDTRLEDEENGE